MSFSKTKLSPLEFRVFKAIGSSMAEEKILIACSGGRDSLALASVLGRLAPRLGFEISALAYVHHGPSPIRGVSTYRKKASLAVREIARAKGIDFVELGPSVDELSSEEELRKFRLGALRAEAVARGVTAVAFAHHADDLFETRLIRLLRGTGARGLEAMVVRKGLAWRPFLSETRDAIEAYAIDQKLEWVEDPSNLDTKALRNWIRLDLLPMIEAKRPGAASAMARSLALLTEELVSKDADLPRKMPVDSARLDRSFYEGLSFVERKRCLSRYATHRGAHDLTSNQIEEIAKRLSSFQSQRRRSGSFVVMGLEWAVSQRDIIATQVLSGARDVLS